MKWKNYKSLQVATLHIFLKKVLLIIAYLIHNLISFDDIVVLLNSILTSIALLFALAILLKFDVVYLLN